MFYKRLKDDTLHLHQKSVENLYKSHSIPILHAKHQGLLILVAIMSLQMPVFLKTRGIVTIPYFMSPKCALDDCLMKLNLCEFHKGKETEGNSCSQPGVVHRGGYRGNRL